MLYEYIKPFSFVRYFFESWASCKKLLFHCLVGTSIRLVIEKKHYVFFTSVSNSRQNVGTSLYEMIWFYSFRATLIWKANTIAQVESAHDTSSRIDVSINTGFMITSIPRIEWNRFIRVLSSMIKRIFKYRTATALKENMFWLLLPQA